MRRSFPCVSRELCSTAGDGDLHLSELWVLRVRMGSTGGAGAVLGEGAGRGNRDWQDICPWKLREAVPASCGRQLLPQQLQNGLSAPGAAEG